MPRYFFHLRFGQRVLPDEEGVELPNRSAAREEALAVVRDLANPEAGSNSRRWASWFLQVADNEGQFFRTPIGHPALEIVTLSRCRRPIGTPHNCSNIIDGCARSFHPSILPAKTYGFAPAASWRAPALPQLTSRQDRRLPHRKPPAAVFACDLVPLRDG